MTYSIAFLLSYRENNSPVRIEQMFLIILFSTLTIRLLTNYNKYLTYIFLHSLLEFRIFVPNT